MTIKSFGEFNSFIITNSLVNTTSEFADFSAVVNQYALICACEVNTKLKYYEKCNSQYKSIVFLQTPEFKTAIFSVTSDSDFSFYHNQDFFIATVTR